jgi:hypothetical protein
VIVGTRTETWLLPNGDHAVVEIEIHHDGSEIVPLHHALFAQMVTDLGFKRAPDGSEK